MPRNHPLLLTLKISHIFYKTNFHVKKIKRKLVMYFLLELIFVSKQAESDLVSVIGLFLLYLFVYFPCLFSWQLNSRDLHWDKQRSNHDLEHRFEYSNVKLNFSVRRRSTLFISRFIYTECFYMFTCFYRCAVKWHFIKRMLFFLHQMMYYFHFRLEHI